MNRTLAGYSPAENSSTAPQDLDSLSRTVATLTNGVVSIEDEQHRVLAYSSSPEGADELRRKSILSQKCPEPYLTHLRQQGVFEQLNAGKVVDVAGCVELGMRRRLAVAAIVDGRVLGSIWVQEAHEPLAATSTDVLTGAARLAAMGIVRATHSGPWSGESVTDVTVALLEGRLESQPLARQLGISPDTPTAVVAFDLRDTGDRVEHELRRGRAASIVNVYASGHRRDALVAVACGHIYTLMPDPAEARLTQWAAKVVRELRGTLDVPAQAAIAGVAPRLTGVSVAKTDAQRVLDVLSRTPERAAASLQDMRSTVLLHQITGMLADRADLRHPALEQLDPEQRRTLGVFLDAFGDTARAAGVLHVHPNTLRHRIRRIAERTGLDLDDPDQRLVVALQLRIGQDSET